MKNYLMKSDKISRKMFLHNLSKDILLDELEEVSKPNKMFFISSLYVIESLLKPKKMQGKIYTSNNIMVQMLTYFLSNGVKLNITDFVILLPNVARKLYYEDSECIEVIMFETEDIGKNTMFLFRKANKTTHVYAGVCTELRSLMFNSVFQSCILDGVAELYVDVGRAAGIDERDPGELENAIDAIEKICGYIGIGYTMILSIPKLGYESLVYHLSERLRARVYISGTMLSVFQYLNKNQYCASNIQEAKIVIAHKSFTVGAMQSSIRCRKYTFLKITDKTGKANELFGFYEIPWSPLPSSFVLKLLTTSVNPERIYPIHHNSFGTQMAPEMPDYLLKLCRHYTPMEAVDEINSTSSVGESCTNAFAELSDENSCERLENKVKDWLFGKQSECQNPKQDTTEKEQQKYIAIKCDKNAKANKRSSLTKSLDRAQHKIETQLSTNAKFYIQKGNLEYLEDSESD